MEINPSIYNISNENLLLVQILNGMYNDNIRQIDRFNLSVSELTLDNIRIRNLIVDMLITPDRSNTTRQSNNTRQHTTFSRNSNTSNNNSPFNQFFSSSELDTSRDLGQIFINNTPYIIDTFQHYIIPSTGNSVQRSLSDLIRNFNDPVDIYPTQSQIEAATRRVRYSDISTPRNRSCPISILDFTDSDTVTIIRHCGHIFHTNELNTWFSNHCTCPVCRFDIRDYNNNHIDIQPATQTSLDNEEDSSESNEERNIIDNSDHPTTNTPNRQPASILLPLLNTHDRQVIEGIISDLSNNIINTSNPYSLFSMISRINNITRQ